MNTPVAPPARQRVLTVLATLALTLTLAVTAAPEAEAATSWTHNQSYSYVIVKNVPTYASGYATAYAYNDTAVTMLCYRDAQYVSDRNYSNYPSARWFKVRINYNGHVGWVHSSYVYYQSRVGRC